MRTNLRICSILLFSFIFDFSKCDKPNITYNECINCTGYREPCRVKTTGWAAFTMSPTDNRRVVALDEYRDGDPTLARCVIDGYDIIGEIETFICFWTPYMGCQAVASKNFVNAHHMHQIACKRCAQYCGCPKQKKSTAIKCVKSYFIMVLTIWLVLSYFKYF